MSGLDALTALLQDAIDVLMSASFVAVGAAFLSLILLWAGTTKVIHPALAAKAVVNFGLTQRSVPLVGFTAGLIEVSLAVGLMLPSVRLEALIGSTTLLWLFVSLLGHAYFRGARFACYCFGSPTSALSPAALARTGVLAVLASSVTLVEISTAHSTPSFHEAVLHALIAGSILGAVVNTTAAASALRQGRRFA